MTETLPHAVPPAYPQARTCPYRLPSEYDRLREGPSITRVSLYDGRTAWLVTRYDTARALLADPRLSSDRSREGFPFLAPRFEAFLDQRPAFIGMDRPEHARHRRMLIGDFTVRRINGMHEEIQEIVDGFLDRMLATGPPADLVRDFSLPVPSMVICKLLGVPYADHDFFQDASNRLVRSQSVDQVRQARTDLSDYLGGLLDERRRDPGPGILGRFAALPPDPAGPDRRDLVSMAVLLLVAGHETTSSMIALSAVTLLDHPDQLAALRADPDRLPDAVEELLRVLSIADLAGSRVATDDIEVDGRTIRAGDGVLVANSIGNRDAEVFDRPDDVDVTRSATHHLAFGYGVHQCLGQNLARMELRIALRALIERVPTLRLAVPAESLRLRPANTIQGVDELPVTW